MRLPSSEIARGRRANFSLRNKSFIVSVSGSSEIKSRVVLLSFNVAMITLSSIFSLIFIICDSRVDVLVGEFGGALLTVLLSAPQPASTSAIAKAKAKKMRLIAVSLLSARGISAVDNERVADHEACARAAKPKNSSGDLLRLTKSANRLVSQDVFHGVRFLSQHVRNHRRIDRPRAHSINANSSGGIFERGAPREPDHSVLGCMVHCAAGNADQTANRRVVDDGAASLLAHLAQLVLHAVPDAAQIDPVYAIEFFPAGISHFHGRRLYTGVIERRIEATEGGYSLRNHRCYLSLIRDVATDANRLVTGGNEFFCRSANRSLVDVCQRHRSSRLREISRSGQTHTRTRAGYECDFV